MKWIKEIIEIKNYSIKVLWNDDIIRIIDLYDFLKSKTTNPMSSYSHLLDYDIFQNVKCDGTTLYWENLIDFTNLDGSIEKGNLDISPELLYEIANSNYKKAI